MRRLSGGFVIAVASLAWWACPETTPNNPLPDATPDAATSDVATDGGVDTSTPPDAGDAGDTGDAGGSDGDVAVNWSYGTPCAENTLVGKFEIGHWNEQTFSYSAVAGEVADGVVPLTILQLVEEVGECRLMQKVNPFCNPPCAAAELCNHDGNCLAYPENQDLGTVTVTGLAVAVSMDANVTKGYAETALPFPMYEAGSKITLSAAGGPSVPAFELSAWGVPNLEVPSAPSSITKGSSLDVTWTAPAPASSPGRLYATLNVDQHGNSPVTLICDVEDTGSYTIAADLITKLLDFGISGFATFQMFRRTVDSIDLAVGCVELRVFAYRLGKIVVAGHTPCNVDPDCTPPQVCNVAINTCVDP